MDVLSRYFGQFRTQLRALTASQQLLIGLLILVMLGTLFFSLQYSAKPETVELLAQSMSAEEIHQVVIYLKGKYPFQVQGDKILVPAEQAYAIRGELASAQALPHDTTAAFAKLAESNDFMRTDRSNERLWNYARQEVLAKVIRNFPFVADATVLISKGEVVGLGRPSVPSSATVSIKLKQGEAMTSAQVLSVVETIRGAVSGLRREDVHLTDGTRAYSAPAEDTPIPTDLLAFKKTIEDDLTRKLTEQLAYIRGAHIAVNVVPDMSTRNVASRIYDPKGIAKVDIESTTHETTSVEGPVNGGQPGVQPNVAAVVANAPVAGPRSSTNSNESTSKVDARFSETNETRSVPAGTEIQSLTASISLPRSYFLGIFRRVSRDAKADPDDATLKPTIDEHVKKIQGQAVNAIGAKNAEQVRVDWFDDTTFTRPEIATPGTPALANAANTAASSGGSSQLMAQYGKQLILGALAVSALFMMMMMVRRAAPVGLESELMEAARPRHRKGDTTRLDVDQDIIGEAEESDAVLMGVELDDEALKSRKIVEEVTTLIKDNPENAASLVKRWMIKGK